MHTKENKTQETHRWSADSLSAIQEHLETDFESGLSSKEASARRDRYGPNTFGAVRSFRLPRIIFRQIINPLALILLVAGSATLILGEYVDTIVIFAALVINVGVGVFQEGRASRAFEKLQKSQDVSTVVVRGGRKHEIPAEDVVPGDVIELEPGQAVPADARLISATNVQVNESALTGEWVDVTKDAEAPVADVPISDQTNMLWMGTLVSAGDARAVVVATGDATEMGKIARGLTEAADGETPLQQNMRQLAYFIATIVFVVIAGIAALGLYRGEPVGEMLLVAVAIAVAAVPSGLPAAVTVVLALGMERILKMGGLVKNLLAAETLGSTTVILTDKTGTLTKAEMRVAEIAGSSDCLDGDAKQEAAEGGAADVPREFDQRRVLEYAVAASDAFVEWSETGDDQQGDDGEAAPRRSFTVRGRPVEKAIVLAGLEAGVSQEAVHAENPRHDFLQFESDRKFSASLHAINEDGSAPYRTILVGAPEVMLERATHVLHKGKHKKLSRAMYTALAAFQEEKSAAGARVIAVAYADTKDSVIPETMQAESPAFEDGIVFAGFIVLADPVRDDAADAVKTAREAGMNIIMVTGDYAATAASVARTVGIAHEEEPVITGSEVERMDDAELLRSLREYHIFARILPQQKLRIARLLKDSGEVVAMTGDGVNDAPALKNADIGVALGSGTDVAKEASDLVILTNGFDIIVGAIREGRKIVDNLKKVVAYLLSTGFSEIFVVGGALIAAAPLPLLPAQILWINIIEEGFMNFAFAFEPAENGLMRRKPRRVSEGILTPPLKALIAIIAGITGLFLIGLFLALEWWDVPIAETRTIMFIALSVDSIFFSLSLKNLRQPLWKINLFSNKYLVGALVGSIGTLFAALLIVPLRDLLSLEPLSFFSLTMIFILGFVNLALIETAKYVVFERRRRSRTSV